jgi:hypothetical protein
MKRHVKRYLLLVYFALPLALLGMGARFPAIPIAPASDYWAVACGTSPHSIPARLRYSSEVGLYPEKDGWLYYFAREHHGQPIFKIYLAEAAKAIPAFPTFVKPSQCTDLGWRETDWCEASVARQPACSTAFSRRATLTQDDVLLLHGRLVAGLTTEERAGFLDRLVRAQLKPAAIAFEAVFLASWQLFLVWPWLRGARPKSRVLHLFLAPLLLFAPFFAGYAPLSFTFGPSGGFVYPFYLLLAGIPLQLLPCTGLDEALLEAVPRTLELLSQLPGPPAAITFYACVGPIACLVAGATISSAYLVGRTVLRRSVR